MTKDEYLYALASVKMDGDYCDEKQYSDLQKLIEEHFDNPPLKFEDLHEGMWVWDDKNKIYNLIYEKRINCAKEKEIEFQWEMPDRECQNFMTDVYEENRFYCREVQNEY
ncbi:hypothetical protein MKA34_03700 [[Clostridium] innocuum]|jgi:hypothetical protein|nr:hypothetical protein [[Clostridium] innocuum]MCR0461727.1 hypothetical protein [[Clostridium] innocuum]